MLLTVDVKALRKLVDRNKQNKESQVALQNFKLKFLKYNKKKKITPKSGNKISFL